ncbi:MAG: Flagellar hook-basal body complex protein FliE [Syntrophaceae bacterium PtaU1.Bin231]|nr:MAG: Flagellar hook-basal body complex protein FliE [Syntrophaceae bacterium PtaU1.Bin231]HOG16738.1 flagellar hook-basal body complex protein FliE [Syntrophales bacterium]
MNDMLVRGGPSPISAGEISGPGTRREISTPFGTVLKGMIGEINSLQHQADQAIAKVQLGNTGSIHEAMIALEKADISFRTMMQVRNKILEAYQEIMRMQV